MLTLTLYVPMHTPFAEFSRLVIMFRDGGYRIGEATFTESTATIQFNKTGVNENGSEQTASAQGSQAHP
jgi:hypothetical protein